MSEFLCVWLPVFALQAARLGPPPGDRRADRAERQAIDNNPAAVVERTGPLTLIHAANHAARLQGVSARMAIPQALGRCPGLHCIPRAPAAESGLAARLRQEADRLSPRVQTVAPDLVLLDLAGLRRLQGTGEEMARRLLKRLADAGLHAHAGLAAQPAMALLAAKSAGVAAGAPAAVPCPDCGACPPWPIFCLAPGMEAARVAALPVEFLAQLGELTHTLAPAEEIAALLEVLARWGIRTLGELAALSAPALRQRLGETGVQLRRLARGEASGLLCPPPLPRDRCQRSLEFDPPVEDLKTLQHALAAQLQDLCRELERSDRVVETLRMRLRRAGGTPQTHTRRFLVPTRDARAIEAQLAMHLEAQGRGQGGAPRGGVQALELRCRTVSPRRIQPRLFAAAAPDRAKLAHVLARLAELIGSPERSGLAAVTRDGPGPQPRARGGRGVASTPVRAAAAITGPLPPDRFQAPAFGSPRLVDSHCPGAYELAPYEERREAATESAASAAPGRKRSPRPAPPANAGASAARQATAALRRYRPPLPAEVSAAASEDLARATLRLAMRGAQGQRFAATIARSAGPWRSGGDWWQPRDWACDEWDVELTLPPPAGETALQSGLYRLRRELQTGAWSLTGRYD